MWTSSLDGDPGPGTPVPTPPPADTAGIASNVQRAYTASKAAGTPLSDDDLEAYARRESGGKLGLQDLANAHVAATAPANSAPSAWDSGIVHAGDAATFGLLPKAVAGVMHLTTGRPYDNLLAAGKQVMGQEQAAHPAASLAGSIGGSIINPANLVLPGSGLDAGVLRTATGVARNGAIMGGLDAAGHSTGSLQDRAQQTATGAGIGGVGGGLLGGLGAAVAPAVSGLARVGRAVGQSGTGAVQNTLQSLVDAGRGSEAALGDLSPRLAALADQSATRSVSAATPLNALTTSRQLGQSGRVLQDLRSVYPGAEPNAPALSAKMETALRDWSASPEGFQGLRDANPVIDVSDLGKTLRSPLVQHSLTAAHLAGDEGIKPGDEVDQMLGRIMADNPTWSKASAQQFAGNGGAALYGAPTSGPKPLGYAEVKALSEDLDRRASAAYDKGAGGLGSNLAALRQTVENSLANVPGHTEAMAEYSTRKGSIRALQSGEKAYDAVDSRQIAPTLAAMTPEQQDYFRTGLASKAIANLRSTGKGTDVANAMTKASDALQDKLTEAFGGPSQFQDFAQRMQAERIMGQMKGATTGSQSAQRIFGATPTLAGLGAAGTGLVTGMAGHPALGAMLAAAPAVGSAVEQHVAGQTGRLLATQSNPAIAALLRRLSEPGPLGRALQSTTSGLAGQAGAMVPGLFNR